MAKKKSNFTLGLNRQQLIETAGRYGRDISKAKKASTKTLENFILRKVVGKGVKLPELTLQDRQDVMDNVSAWGLGEGLKRLTYRASKLANTRNEESFLRLTLTENFALYRDNRPTAEEIDELISRLPRLNETQVDSDLIAISPYYDRLFRDYADELEEQEMEEQMNNERLAQEQFDEQTNSSSKKRKSKAKAKTKRKR